MAEYNESAANHALKIKLIRAGYFGAIIVTLVYSAMCAGLFIFRDGLSFEAVLAIMGAFGTVYLVALNHFLNVVKDGSGFAFGSSQSSADEKVVSKTLADATNKMADEGVVRANTAAIVAGTGNGGAPEPAPATTKLAKEVAANTAATKTNTEALKTTTEETTK